MSSRRLERALSRSAIAPAETASAEVPGSRTWVDRVVDPLHGWLKGEGGSVSLYAVINRVREVGGSVPAALLMFKEVDADGDGQLSEAELRTGLARAAHDPALQLLVQLAAECEKGASGGGTSAATSDGRNVDESNGSAAAKASRAKAMPSLPLDAQGAHRTASATMRCSKYNRTTRTCLSGAYRYIK